MKISTFPESRPRIAVISHERSGTHFLMNSVASAYGYVSKPWIDFDYHQAHLNFFHPPSVARFFRHFDSIFLANTVKSHHHFDFFSEVVDQITESFVLLYIYRDPRSVLSSLCPFLNGLEWMEGPRTKSPPELMRAEPCGQMLRYQKHQAPNMLARWGSHVTGWLNVAEARADNAILPVRYEDLSDRYPETITAIGEKLGLAPLSMERPRADKNVVAPNAAGPGGNRFDEWSEADLVFIEEQVGPLMRRLGYGF